MELSVNIRSLFRSVPRPVPKLALLSSIGYNSHVRGLTGADDIGTDRFVFLRLQQVLRELV